MQLLKQSTSQTIQFGPFVDKTDGITLKADATTITDIDHATTGIFLSKNGGNAAIRYQTSKVASVADAYGMMKVTLLATDTNTLGMLDVSFAKAATYLPVHKNFMVIPVDLWNTLFVAQPAAAINQFFDVASPTGTVNSLPNAVAGAASGIAIVGSSMVVPNTQKVDVETIKTRAVVCAATTTILASVGAPAAPGASGGIPTTDGTKLNQTVDLTAGQQIDITETTIAEMAQGAPPASPTIKQILNYLYRKLRNKNEATATVNSVYDDAGTTVLFKETHSDDATTFTKGEYITGA